MAGPSPAVPIAPGKTNTITNDCNTVRLPFGVLTWDPKPTGSSTLYWVTVPSDTGGTVNARHEDVGTVTLFAADGTTKLAGGGPTLEYEVKPPFHGILYILAEGGSERRIFATFTQVSFARTGPKDTDPPLVPWNFYFWPAARHADPGQTKELLRMAEKLGRVFKGAPAGAKAKDWEYHHHTMDGASPWAGHCHNAAAASILFEKPVEQKIKGETVTAAELQVLATEWFGNYGQMETRPVRRGGDAQPASFVLVAGTAPVGENDQIFLPMYFKPGDEKNARNLAYGLRSYFPKWDAEKADKVASQLFQEHDYAATINKYFGGLAAQFYACLIKRIRIEHHALQADLRSSGGLTGPAEIWNHAVFYYKAAFEETDPRANNPEDVIVTIELVANTERLDTEPPAYVDGSGISLGNLNRHNVNELRLIFQSGKIAMDDPRNEWRSTRSALPRSSPQLHAPRYLARLLPVGAKPGKFLPSDPDETSYSLELDVGNQYVEMEPLSGSPPALKIRSRYK